ncbi:MAG: hypothetical protein L0H79_05190 [Intrasporangium sp.]|uniref:SAV_6107 family HEPN domain-containing protein n=1 Tax=Intrasporangium sp. TaxID=1925024 RepID=UPI0026482D4A|nr:SAV_6107 family HEPN domain-containing protein [Intrasporangium sp.]MDN5795131.1 hypothetical protein [Intrasporangium sp.]
MTTMPVPASHLPFAVTDLLERSRVTLESACQAADAAERHREACLGALRAAAALVAARTSPVLRGRPRSVWRALPEVAPELGEWAAFFAGASRQQTLADRGGWVTVRAADDLLRQSGMFLTIVSDLLGVPLCTPLPESTTPALAVSRHDGSGV